MLEILVLVFCCKSLGDILRRKGRKPLVFQIMLVLSWFAAQFIAGLAFGIVMVVIQGGEPPEFNLLVYVVALIGAACAAGFWFMVAKMLSPAPSLATSAELAAPTGAGNTSQFLPPADPNNPYASPQR